MSAVERLSRAVLRELLADFTGRNLSVQDLCDSYVGVSLAVLKDKCCSETAASLVDFDLALKDLEGGGLAATGPMVPYENDPNSFFVIFASYSKNEYAYLTEKGYKAAQKAQTEKSSRPTNQHVHISGGTFHQSPIGIGGHVTQTLLGTLGDAPIFTDFRKAVDESSLEHGDREQLLAGITAMESAPDGQSFVAHYADFIALAANHMTIIAPFLPALSALLRS